MGIQPSYGGMVALATKAMEHGADRQSQSHFDWDISGYCRAPVVFEQFARPTVQEAAQLRALRPADRREFIRLGLVATRPIASGFEYAKGDNHPLWVTLTVRCRKCSWCLKQRAILWANKAKLEIERAPRTWFATYTASPDQHFIWESIARMSQHESDKPFEALDPVEQFRRRCAAAGPDITRYIKRVRKQSESRFRYLFVAERHESGLPHWHALVHEVPGAMPIRKAVLKEQWPYGFTRFKLAENKGAAWYLCKYLSKDLATRVRSSLLYGRMTDGKENFDLSHRLPRSRVVDPPF